MKLTPDQKHALSQGLMLPLMEEFYTIQGEGFHTGKAAWFIRLGGCDVGCRWCDVKESWNPDLHPLTKTEEIIANACESKANTVVITGGEPLMYYLDFLCAGLKNHNIQTFLETSGSYPLTGKWDWICLSPKKNSPPDENICQVADEIKMIIYNESDIEWAEKYAGMVSSKCRLYLQPEWSRYKYIIPFIVDYVKSNPKWMISLQSHKFMHIP